MASTPACYVLAAVLVDTSERESIRAQLEGLLLRTQPRIHFHVEASARRHKLVAAVASTGCVAVVVVGAPMDPRRQERARRYCLTRIIWELRERDVVRIVCESPGRQRDNTDVQLFVGLRRFGVLTAGMQVEYAAPSGELGETLLWLPDIVAGAHVAAVTSGDLNIWTPLADLAEVVEIKLK